LEWGKEAGSVPDGLVLYDHGSDTRGTGISLQNNGNNNAHENIQPTVMVPYIVKLDG
jgi:microcystin-dependent protein